MSSILYNDKLYGGATTALDADHVLYDNTDSGLTSSNVQDVVDELDEVIESLENPTFTEASTRANIASGESLATIFGKVKKVITDLEAVAFSGAADDVSYDNTDSGLTATNVQDAVDELNSNLASKTDVLSRSVGILDNLSSGGFTDLNNLTTKSGLYYFGSNIANAPQSYVLVLNIVSGPDILQIAFPMSSAKIYRRRHSNAGWGAWNVIDFA